MIKKSNKRLVLQQLEERVLLDANPLLAIDSGGESGAAEPLDVPLTSAAEAIVSESLNITATQEEKAPEEQPAADDTQQINAPQEDSSEIIAETEDIPVSDTSDENITLPTETNDETDQSSQTDENTDSFAVDEQTTPLEASTESPTELIIVDSRIHESDSFIEEISQLQSDPDKDITIVEINSDTSGVDQIAELLTENSGVDALHVFSHGVDGRVYLGSDVLYSANFDSYDDALQDWDLGLNDGADILLYGCSIAESEDGKDIVELLASSTGADVAASIDDTGNPSQGADWDLEYSVGDVTTDTLIPTVGIDGWNGVLDPTPTVTVDMPADGLIEEEIEFTVTFDNTGDAGDVGYAPYMEVYIPVSLNITGVTDASADIYNWDGTAWVAGGTSIIPDTDNHPLDNSEDPQLTVRNGAYIGDSWYIFKLPFGSYTPEQPSFSVEFTAELDEDAVAGVEHTVDWIDYEAGDALVDTPIQVVARGGFQYGLDPIDNPNSDPAIEGRSTYEVDRASGEVTPRLFTINKTSDAPEGQSATGPNYPVTYTIEVDIAPDQIVEDLVLTDWLPDNAVYRGDLEISGALIQDGSQLPDPWTSGENILLNLGDVIGNNTDGVTEITLTYSAYYDATALGSCGDSSTAMNVADATGDYDHPTIDDVDGHNPTFVAVDPDSGNTESSVQHQLNSITAEKFVTITEDNGSAGLTPGDILTYRVYFEISDYFGFENIVVTDLLGDGQDITGTNPTLTIIQGGEETNLNWDLTDPPADSFLDITRSTDTGISTVEFDVSGLLGANGFTDGELYGDLFNSTGTNSTDNTVNRPGGGTYGWIDFEAIIEDDYLADNTVDNSVDANDPIDNNITISGDVLSTTYAGSIVGYQPQTLNGEVCTQDDNSETELEIIGIAQEKSIENINHEDPAANGSNYIGPGDVVTYRLFTSLPIGSVEEFVITDYLPLPIFDVAEFDPDNDGVVNFSNTIEIGQPIDPDDLDTPIDLTVGGQVYWGTETTLQNAPGIGDSTNDWSFEISTNDSANSLIIDLGTFNSDGSAVGPWNIEILITATVQNTPFSDDLNLTNQATWHYDNTFGELIDTGDIVQVEMVAPEVTITKGVIATDNPDGEYDTDPPEELTNLQVNDPSSANPDALSFSDTVTAADFLANPMNSNLSGVDGGDLVTFAVSIANAGGSGAYGLHVRDTRPEEFILPSGDANIQVWDGQGNLLEEGTDYNFGADGFFDDGDADTDDDGIIFTAYSVLDGDRLGERPDGTEGDDLFIITYTLEADNETTITPGMVEAGSENINTASINYYSGSNNPAITAGDGNWIDPGDPPQDDALVTLSTPTVEKVLVGTEIDEGDGNGLNGANEAVVGELVYYTTSITVPEGKTLNVILEDTLDKGLELVSIDSIEVHDQYGNIHPDTIGSGVLRSSAWDILPGQFNFEGFSGQYNDSGDNLSYTHVAEANSSFTLDLGDIENFNSDNNTDEVIVISYTAMVVNEEANNHGEERGNSAVLSYDVPAETGSETKTTDPVSSDDITIIEPQLKVVKTSGAGGSIGGITDLSGPPELLDNPQPDWVAVEAGDYVEYTIVISHEDQTNYDAGTTAYGVTFYDQLPTDYFVSGSVNLVSAIYSGTNADIKDDFSIGSTTVELNPVTPFDLHYGETLSITISAHLDTSLDAGLNILNYGEIDWTSLPGDRADISGFVSDGSDAERTGDDVQPINQNNFPIGVDVTPAGKNDYGDYDPTQLSVIVESDKYVISTSIGSGTGTDGDGINNGLEAVIGEFITYQVDLHIPEAEMYNTVLTDILDPGLVLQQIDSITLTNEHAVNSPPNSVWEFENEELIDWDWTNNPYDDPNILGLTDDDGINLINYTHNAGSTGFDELTIDFGTIKNFDPLHNEDEIVTITYTVMVTDIFPANAGNGVGAEGTMLNNQAQLTWEWADGTPKAGLPFFADQVEVIEPELSIEKGVTVEGPGDAGDTVTYTFTVQHTENSEADAFDLTIEDTFDDNLDPSSLTIESVTIGGTVLDQATITSTFTLVSGQLLTNSPYTLDLDYGQTMVMVISAEIAKADDSVGLVALVSPGDEIENSVQLTWTSIDNTGSDTWEDGRTGYSNFAPSDLENQERGPHTDTDVYTDVDIADTITVPGPTIEKELVGTNMNDAANENGEATIGEIITYRVTVNLTEGITETAQIVDILGPGLEYADISPTNVVEISRIEIVTGSQIRTDLVADGTLTIDNILGTPSLDPTSGQAVVTFDLGNLTIIGDNSGTTVNPLDTIQGDDRLIIEYRAVVTDIETNNALDGTAETFTNTAQFKYTNDNGDQTVDPTSPTENVTLVEPNLQVIKEVGTPGNILSDPALLTDVDAGDEVVYKITINHNTSNSGSGAYDVLFNDILPEKINFTPATISVGGDLGLTASDFIIDDNDGTGGTLRFTNLIGTNIQYGQTLWIELTGVLNDTVEPNEEITNDSSISWTSLPEGHENNTQIDERTPGEHSDPIDYQDSDDAIINITTPTITKSGDGSYTIGDVVTYEIDVTLPEGSINGLIVRDDLPAGLNPISGESYVNDSTFDGIWSVTTNTSAGDGNDVIFDFSGGTVVTTGGPGTTNNVLTLVVKALVTDFAPNIQDASLSNTASLEYTDSNGVSQTVGNPTAEIDIVEPQITTTKTVVDESGDTTVGRVNEVLTYTVTFENTGESTAYDTSALDILATGTGYLGLTSAWYFEDGEDSTNNTLGTDILASTAIDSSVTGQLSFSSVDPNTMNDYWDIATGATVKLTYEVEVLNAWFAGGAHTNTIDADWYSQNTSDTNGRLYDDGITGPGSPVDGDQDNDSAQFYVPLGEGTLGHLVWLDFNDNGEQDSGEAGIPDVEVQLSVDIISGGIVIDTLTYTTTTDTDGLYYFTHLSEADNYTVTVNQSTLPAGLDLVFDYDGEDDHMATYPHLGFDEEFYGLDFGYQGLGSLGNRVWFDIDEDGMQDNIAIEIGIPNVTVILTADLNGDGTVDLTQTTQTNDSGEYLFDNLPFVDYRITVDPFSVLESSRVQSWDRDANAPDGALDHTTVIDAADWTDSTTYPGNFINDVDFGYHGEGQLGNLVWDDLNGDGIHNPAEPGIDGVTVVLWIDVNNDGETDAIHSTVTTPLGTGQNYIFENLPSGTFTVLIDPLTLPDEYIQSYDYQWNTTDGLNNRSDITITLAEQSNYEQDFGYTQTGSIGDTIWYDANANSSQDDGEPGLTGVTVTLVGDVDLDSIEDTLTTTTDENGNYIFDDIPIGNYTITVAGTTLPEGMVPTYDLNGIETINSTVVALAYNEDKSDVDFGYTGTGSIGDKIWLDSNRNGVQDSGEPGISGVEITLEADIDQDGSIDYTTSVTTDSSGNYLFENLPSGSYNLYLDPNTVPSDLLQTFDPDGRFDLGTNISLDGGENNLLQDFGFAPPEPPTPPVVTPVVPPTGPPEAGDPVLAYQFAESAADRAIMPMPEPEEPFLLPTLPVSPVYTGRAEPGTTITLTVYDAIDGAISYQTVMADAGGNWLASFPATIFYDIPVRMEISQTEAIYNASTPGAFNFRTYFNPALSSMVFSSMNLDVDSVMAYQAGTIEKAISGVHNSALELAWDDFSGYEFFSTSINPAQHTR